VTLLGPGPSEPRVPVVSIVNASVDTDRLAFMLDRRYGIAVRAGLHCAPWAHRTLGTLETGAVRFGVGFGNTPEDIDAAVAAVAELTAGAAG
jgi:cysteine desulfurase/selenocysteine lyase